MTCCGASSEAPGIERAAITDSLPFGRNRTWGAGAKGVTYERGKYPLAFVRVVSEGYPAAMGIPLLAGRDFSASDMPGRAAGDADQQDPRERAVARRGSDRQVHRRPVRRRAARGRSRQRRAASVAGAAVWQRDVHPGASVRRPGGFVSGRTLASTGRHARGDAARRAHAAGAKPRPQRFPHAAADRGPVGLAAALHRAAAGSALPSSR